MKLAALLCPHADVGVGPSGFIAVTGEPWLELKVAQGVPAGRWIRLSYRASYLDHLVRPLIRFETETGVEWDTMCAPLFGEASWIGRAPEKTTRILISPVDQPGPFGFEIVDFTTVSRFWLIWRALRNDFKTYLMALGARFINARQECRQALRFARGGIEMAKYARWRMSHYRRFDPAGLDAPRHPLNRLPHVRIILPELAQSLTRHAALFASLRASAFENWSIRLLQPVDAGAFECLGLGSHIAVLPESGDVTDGLSAGDIVARLDPSVAMADYALPVLLETAARAASAECLYADENWLDADGRSTRPVLKPDWSPQFEAAGGYLGHLVFWRVDKIRRVLSETTACFETAHWRHCALQNATGVQVHHIRRVLATCPADLASKVPADAAKIAASHSGADVSVIIPTKDQLPLLKECLRGLRFETSHPILEILIVDNGSGPDVQMFYACLADDPRIKIIHMPGRFNFSAMCNAAGAAARGGCLVFLNNDMSVVKSGWLGPLVVNAMRPDIGAVGARLLFPGGRVQHAGVVVGMGGYADHVSHGAAADYIGYLGRMGVPHEVSAVTGACLAVEGRKFRAVGGFDADRYPVELNDIDLCLRLAAAGWRSLMCPEAVLIHHQSATRGFSFRPFQRYGLERGHFRKTWMSAIRDDPYFHPALSLFCPEPSLDG